MSYVPTFESDIFVIYAKPDDEAGWVTNFTRELRNRLHSVMGLEITVWPDSTINSSDIIWDEDKIRRKMHSSAVLLCIVSPNWSDSQRKEVEEFQSTAIQNSQFPVRQRIFRALKNFPDIINGYHPSDDIPDFTFYEYIADTEFREFSPEEDKFHAKMARLTEEISRTLKSLRSDYRPEISEGFEIIFSPDLSDHEIKTSFAALADYYRACGGIGLSVEHELEEVQTREVANV